MNLDQLITNNDMKCFTYPQLIWLSTSIGITCHANVINDTNNIIYTFKNLPSNILIDRLLDYFNLNIKHENPIIINQIHYSSYISKYHITYDINDYILINKFNVDDWNCRCFLRKHGMTNSKLINDIVITLWIKSNTNFTYKDLQNGYINLNLVSNNTSNLNNTCKKLIAHSYLPIIELIYKNNKEN